MLWSGIEYIRDSITQKENACAYSFYWQIEIVVAIVERPKNQYIYHYLHHRFAASLLTLAKVAVCQCFHPPL